MFIPLASTTSASSSPSPSTPPLDDSITTVKHYIYIHTTLNPRTHDTTKKYYFNWHENIKHQSHCIYNSTCPYRCCPEMCRYCSRGNSYSQRSKIQIQIQIQIKLKIISKCKTENCVYTFSIYNISIFFTITINPTIG